MTTYEIQIRDRIVYVTAKSEAKAEVAARKLMTPSELHWTTPIFTGRNR